MSDPAPPPPRQGALTIFSAIFLPMFLAIMDQTIIAAALPEIASDLGNAQQITWVVTAYLIAATLAAPTFGRLGDLFGRKRLMIVSISLFVMASAVCSLAQSIYILVLGRLAQGLSGGGLITLSNALIGETISPRERPRFQGYLATISVSASALGPVLGGYVAGTFGWRFIFLLNFPLGLLALFFLFRIKAQPGIREKRPFDVLGLAYLAVFVTSALLNFSFAQEFVGGRTWPFISCALLAGLALVLLVRRENAIRYPLLPVHLLRQAAIWRSDGLAACHGATFVSLLTFTPIYLWAVRGMSLADIGVLMLPLSAGVGIGSMMTGWAVTATGRSAIFPSIGMMAAAVLLVFLASASGDLSILQITVLLGLIALCLGTTMIVVQVTVQSVSSLRVLGAAAGTVSLSRSIGAALGTGAVSMVFFLVLARSGPEVLYAFPDALNTGAAPGSEGARIADRLRIALEPAFAGAFLLIACFAAAGSLMAWMIPMRRI